MIHHHSRRFAWHKDPASTQDHFSISGFPWMLSQSWLRGSERIPHLVAGDIRPLFRRW